MEYLEGQIKALEWATLCNIQMADEIKKILKMDAVTLEKLIDDFKQKGGEK
ncbi:hypothetical protein [Desulfosporosinus sp.]|uniref:hypothetical protein n=1 Tax=Desulfosporosinus sp. TaxID=157907 RepID=UPI0026305012|nr:hypothetical protein [Desulfosporosinus sp.]